MIINQKDLVLLPFPFSNLEKTKVRPALVVSNHYFNSKSHDCILVPLTTNLNEESFSIIITQSNLDSGKLIKPSKIRADKIFTAKKDLITIKIGSIQTNILEKIKSEISKMF
jgi:mRNA interferase MazF|tara:strand:+ start:181 stop:516 length:336 start_codon:yes stop_codon:yes gene_type:complete